MTRAEITLLKLQREKERLADKEREARDLVAAQRKAVAIAESAVRDVARQENNKRRYHVGALADEAGLLAWSNAELAAVFAALTRLRKVPSPGAVLDAVLDSEALQVAGGVK